MPGSSRGGTPGNQQTHSEEAHLRLALKALVVHIPGLIHKVVVGVDGEDVAGLVPRRSPRNLWPISTYVRSLPSSASFLPHRLLPWGSPGIAATAARAGEWFNRYSPLRCCMIAVRPWSMPLPSLLQIWICYVLVCRSTEKHLVSVYTGCGASCTSSRTR